jgi:type I restriction enzyme S subunit
MMSSWRECKLGDVLELKYGKDHKALNDGTIPVFGSGGIMRYADTFLYDDESILIPRKGTLNNIFYINEPFWTVDTIFWSKINTKEAFGKFLFYQLKTIDFANLNVGSAVPSLTTKVLNEVDISLPPLEEQKAIAEVLSSLDDKIDLLHRQNQTLESLAQTLFRQWFIEEAKEELEEKPLSQIADFLNGLACQKFPPQNDIDKLPVLKIKDLKDGVSENSDYATSDVKPEYIVNNGDVIFAWSASLMVKIWDGEQCVLNQHLFKVTSKDFPKWFYYQWCKYHLDNFIAISSEHATTMGHIKRGDLDEAMCIIPSSEELLKMDEQISPIFEKLEINSKQIKSLEKMRDTLLPKLLNGEVRVNYE